MAKPNPDSDMESAAVESKAPSPRPAGALQNSFSRRDFLSTAIAAPIFLGALRNAEAAGEVINFKSPNSELQFL
jgi:hypothetical protein